MSSGKRVVLSLLGLLLGFVLITVAIRAMPPTPEEQLATARRLEALITRMDELGLDGWQDCPTCQPIEIRPGSSPVPLPPGETPFEAMKAATEGVVPNGRLVMILVERPDQEAASDPATGPRIIRFSAVARSMIGAETGHDLWTWTWNEEPRAIGPTSLDEHWEFLATSAEKDT
jgi:hypothetical protein